MTTYPPLPVLPRKCFGRIVCTGAVQLNVDPAVITSALRRHMANDWGELDEHDHSVNAEAIRSCDGGRVMSNYTDLIDEPLWVISYVRNDELMHDPECCNTCVLFPADY